MKVYYTKPKTFTVEYENLIRLAIDKIEQAIDTVSYGTVSNEIIDYDTGKPINNDIIIDLNNVISALEDIQDKTPMEPNELYIKKENK